MPILFILLLLVFIPFPIKLEISYKDFFINLKIFNKSLIDSDLRNILDYIKNKDLKEESKTYSKNKKFFKRFLENKQLSIKDLFSNLNSNKFKPTVKIKTLVNFGINDAATCAIVYGLLWNLPLIIRTFLTLIFNVKNISLSLTPKFNKNHLLFNINSIFYISFANIIYIAFLLFKSLKNKEEIINE